MLTVHWPDSCQTTDEDLGNLRNTLQTILVNYINVFVETLGEVTGQVTDDINGNIRHPSMIK